MRILQIVHSLPFLNYAGTEIYTHDLSFELSKRHEVFIFARNCDIKRKDYEVVEKKINKVTIYLINNTFKHCDSFEMYFENNEIDEKFVELLLRIKPDVIHIHHLVFLSIGLIRKINDMRIPIVFTIHDYWLMCPKWHILKEDLLPCEKVFANNFNEGCLSCLGEILNIKKSAKIAYFFSKKLLPDFLVKRLKKIYFLFAQKMPNNGNGIIKLRERISRIKALLNTFDIFFVPSEYVKNKFIEFGIPQGKIRFSRHGLDNNLFLNIQKSKCVKIRFAFIGTILPAKGAHILINSFNRIDKYKGELKIYGRLHAYTGFESYPAYLKKITKNRNIRFMGEFKHSDVANIFRDIDVLVVPSIWYENSPLVIQEAFLSKTPVIASRIGGIPELVSDRVNGLLFKPADAHDLQSKIQYVIDNPDILEKFRSNIPKVKSIEDNAKEIEEAYSSLTAKGKSY